MAGSIWYISAVVMAAITIAWITVDDAWAAPELTSLSVDSGSLWPSFRGYWGSYHVTEIPRDAGSVTLTMTTNVPGGSVVINGTTYGASGTITHAVNMPPLGPTMVQNWKHVTIYVQNGTDTARYDVDFYYRAPPVAVTSLLVDVGVIPNGFRSYVESHDVAGIPSGTTQATLTIESNGTDVTIDGTHTLGGPNGTVTIPISPRDNTVTMVPSSSTGSSVYTLTFVYDGGDDGGEEPQHPSQPPPPVITPPRFIPVLPPRDTTPPTITSIDTHDNMTVTVGDGRMISFNVTFSERVSGVDLSDFVLVVDNATHHQLSGNATSTINMTNHGNWTIPDVGTFTDTMTIDDPGMITGASLSIDMDHIIPRAISINLTTPDCTTIPVVANGTAVFTSDLSGVHEIPGITGMETSGIWRLSVQDHQESWTGTVFSWMLEFDTGVASEMVELGRYTWGISTMPVVPGNHTLTVMPEGHGIRDNAGNRLVDAVPTGHDGMYTVMSHDRSDGC